MICFTGVDGSGKTTHARALLKFLKHNGCSCAYVWGAFRPILSYTFFAFTRLFGYWKIMRKNAFTNPLEYAPERVKKNFASLMRLLFFIDFQIKTSLKIRLPLLLGKNIICDRYFYDLLMELELNNLSSKNFVYLVSITLPQPLITFLMDANETAINKRRNFSLKELQSKRKIFLRMSKSFNFAVINSRLDYSYNQKRIQKSTFAHIHQSTNLIKVVRKKEST
jgi:dTMP kinase